MAENKKYYFLKLKEDFFDQREIVVLEGSKDGVLYVNILLKLYLKSLQHNGKLLLNEMTPLSAEMIALLTRHEVGTVERAMRAFMQLGLVEVLEDNTFYMPEIEEMTGKGSSDGERKARYRRQKAESSTLLLPDKNTGMGQNRDNVPPLSQICPPEIRDKSIENRTYIKESDREKSAHAPTGLDKGINLYGRYGNVILTDQEMETLKSDFPSDCQSMIEHLSEYMASTGKTYKNHLATMERWKKADMKKEHEKGYSYNGNFREGGELMIGAVVDKVLKEMENAANGGMKAADDYKDTETGLLMCGKCHTRKQKKISFLGEERIVGCLCRCAAEELEKGRAEREAEENLMRIRQMKSAGLQDRTFYGYTFERCDAAQENAVYAKRYVEHFTEMTQTGQGLLFWGNVGTGKTFLAGCIANALLEQKIPVLMTSFPKILNALGGLYSAERNEYLASLNRYTLLVIDDMGIERESQYTLETVYTVIDERYKSGKPFIITTNIQLDILGNPQDLEHARIYDRIMERCMPVFFGGRNYRSELGQGNRDKAKKILTGVNGIV